MVDGKCVPGTPVAAPEVATAHGERIAKLEAENEAMREALKKVEREVEEWYDQKQYAPTTFANIGTALGDALASLPPTETPEK